ncbi:hypothetical protein [Streptomyces sp. OK228]|uniref:hypothetical protein n=1 Tax=Streptomyces sp. OK228 TaxID=1882786 RepID=UPI0015CF795E|nr:hypothetical protein [Streptomyces sp. OK228]
MNRRRLERVCASAGIAQLALQQIQDDVTAADVDAAELAAILLELSEDTDSPGGLAGSDGPEPRCCWSAFPIQERRHHERI